ncbi:hypothetical protein TNCV_3605681 [Trichonephila clavipes]|uniref:Uncharacterized protein n=1 Tax=Trichonephila clavipes TaxID=2585209 RepID=A0A8X6RMA7_TRICX|nr:hypothetical protein TNCV_3605681 [Trichonephila clavipes]
MIWKEGYVVNTNYINGLGGVQNTDDKEETEPSQQGADIWKKSSMDEEERKNSVEEKDTEKSSEDKSMSESERKKIELSNERKMLMGIDISEEFNKNKFREKNIEEERKMKFSDEKNRSLGPHERKELEKMRRRQSKEKTGMKATEGGVSYPGSRNLDSDEREQFNEKDGENNKETAPRREDFFKEKNLPKMMNVKNKIDDELEEASEPSIEEKRKKSTERGLKRKGKENRIQRRRKANQKMTDLLPSKHDIRISRMGRNRRKSTTKGDESFKSEQMNKFSRVHYLPSRNGEDPLLSENKIKDSMHRRVTQRQEGKSLENEDAMKTKEGIQQKPAPLTDNEIMENSFQEGDFNQKNEKSNNPKKIEHYESSEIEETELRKKRKYPPRKRRNLEQRNEAKVAYPSGEKNLIRKFIQLRKQKHIKNSNKGDENTPRRGREVKPKRPRKEEKRRRKKHHKSGRKRPGRWVSKERHRKGRKPPLVEEHAGDSESEEKKRKKKWRPIKRPDRPRIPSALPSSEETDERWKKGPERKTSQKNHTESIQNDPHGKNQTKGTNLDADDNMKNLRKEFSTQSLEQGKKEEM